ncbi:MAG: hypothetical protein FWD31_10055 [Planctomycetaceae bacterium]|nr:hypothetical protein [Planctomycetaceae bacterium]
MTEKLPPYNEFRAPRNDLGEYSEILDELARIRQNIERDSTPIPIAHSGDLETESFSNAPDTFRQFYRIDSDHSEREGHGSLNIDSKAMFNSNMPSISVRDRNSDMQSNELRNGNLTKPLIPQQSNDLLFRPQREHTETCPNHHSRPQKPINTEIKHKNNKNNLYDDDTPVVIPFRSTGTQTSAQNSNFDTDIPHHTNNPCDHQQSDPPKGHVTDFAALPWGVFSQYENATFLKLSRNASNWSLFIGWGAIACGVVILVRSFFVSSLIWLNYGMPVLSLGAACLFLGIVLSILSDKMQHINDLKQSLTAHKILTPSNKKPDHHARQHENVEDELEDTYGRLVKLRAEINELIDECENPLLS